MEGLLDEKSSIIKQYNCGELSMKYVFYISFLFLSVFAKAQVKVGPGGDIIPTGPYPAAKYFNTQTGWWTVSTISERDTIPAIYRKIGLICHVAADSTNYQLINGIANANWKKMSNGGGSVDSLRILNDTIQLLKTTGWVTQSVIDRYPMWSEAHTFTYNGSNNVITLLYSPTMYAPSFLQSVFMSPFSEYTISGNQLTIKKSLLDKGISYTVSASYYYKR